MKKIVYTIIVLFSAVGCAEDNGNYDYTELNKITIGNIEELYEVDQYDNLVIEPELTFDFEALSDISYEWFVNNQLISTEPNCNAYMEMAPKTDMYGRVEAYDAVLCVTNKANNLKYYKAFQLKVGAPYTNSMLLLSERKDGTSNLSFKRMDKPDAALVHNVFENANPQNGELGRKPSQIVLASMLGDICVLNKEGDKRMVRLAPVDMSVSGIYDAHSASGYDGEFIPSSLNIFRTGIILGDGQLFGFNYMNNETVYLAAEGDYDMAWADANIAVMESWWCGYDNKNERFLSFKNSGSIYFDNMEEVKSESFSTKGQKFLAGGALGDFYKADKRVILLDNAGTAHFYKLLMNYGYDASGWNIVYSLEFDKTMEKQNIADKFSVAFLAVNSSYWYISKGNQINRLFADGGDITTCCTLPKGNPVTMMADAKEERLFISTFDGEKSYIYTLNLLTNQLVGEPMEMEGKVVSMLAMGNWKY